MDRTRDEYEEQWYGFTWDTMHHAVRDLVAATVRDQVHAARNTVGPAGGAPQDKWDRLADLVVERAAPHLDLIKDNICHYRIPKGVLLPHDQYCDENMTPEERPHRRDPAALLAEEAALTDMVRQARHHRKALEEAHAARELITARLADDNVNVEKLVHQLNEVKQT